MAFVKLDRGILTSTIWSLRPELEIFVTALLLAEPFEITEPTPTIAIGSLEDGGWSVPPGWYGFVPAAGPGIVQLAHVEAEKGTEALKRLAQPEPGSRSQAFDGRRMVRIDGGFIVLNFIKYRDHDHTAADRMRRFRKRKKQAVTANTVTVQPNVTYSRGRKQKQKAESDVTIDTQGGRSKSVPTLEQWLEEAKRMKPDWPAADAETAWHHYESNGWRVGSNPVRRWQSCIVTCYGNWRNKPGRRNGTTDSAPKPKTLGPFGDDLRQFESKVNAAPRTVPTPDFADQCEAERAAKGAT